MKTILLFATIVLLTSCGTQYHYFTLSSTNTRLNDKKEFVGENDTLVITYNFSGLNGPVTIGVFNNSSRAVEIDWKRSSLIIGNKVVALYQPNIAIKGLITRDKTKETHSSGPVGHIDGSINREESIEFIPPKGKISRTGLSLASMAIDLQAPVYQPSLEKLKNGKMDKVKVANFTLANSPMTIRSYLSFLIPGEPGQIQSIEHNFYLSDILRSETGPQWRLPSLADGGNQYYISGPSSRGGPAIAGLLGMTVLVIAVAGS
jgi:hypothetical protein